MAKDDFSNVEGGFSLDSWGSATPLDPTWQEEWAAKLRKLRAALNKAKPPAAAVAELAALKALGWNRAPETTVGLMGPEPREEGSGLGEMMIGEAPASWEKQPYNSAFTQYGRVPLPVAKPGRAGDVVNMGTTLPFDPSVMPGLPGPLDLLPALKGLPGLAGVIRRKADVLTPDVAKGLADRLSKTAYDIPMRGSFIPTADIGPMQPLSREAAYQRLPDIKEKLTTYLQKLAGRVEDPLQQVPALQQLPQPPGGVGGPRFETTYDYLDMPPPGEVKPAATAQSFRMETRPEELIPDTSTLGYQVDDIIGRSLATGKDLTETVRATQKSAALPEERINEVRDMARSLGYEDMAREINPTNIQRRAERAKGELSTGSGIRPENQNALLEALPADAVVAANIKGSMSTAEGRFRNFINHPQFLEYNAKMHKVDPDAYAKMTLPDLVKGFQKDNELATKVVFESAHGAPVKPMTAAGKPVVDDAGKELSSYTNDNWVWEDLAKPTSKGMSINQLCSIEGKRQGLCIGLDSYAQAVSNGGQRMFSLKEKNTNKPLLTVNFVKREELPDISLGPQQWLDEALFRIREANDGGETIDRVSELISRLYEGDDYYKDGLKNELTAVMEDVGRGAQPNYDDLDANGVLRDLLRKFTRNGAYFLNQNLKGQRYLDETRQFLEFGGVQVPQGTERVWLSEQIKGKNNAKEGLPDELKREAQLFVDNFLQSHGEKVKATDTGLGYTDYQDLFGGGPSARYRRFGEEEQQSLKELYNPENVEMKKFHQKDVLLKGDTGEAYTQEKAGLLRGSFAEREPGKPVVRWSDFQDPEHLHGGMRTEIARLMKRLSAVQEAEAAGKPLYGPRLDLDALSPSRGVQIQDTKKGRVIEGKKNAELEALRRFILRSERQRAAEALYNQPYREARVR